MGDLPGEAWAFFGVALTGLLTLLTKLLVDNRRDAKEGGEEKPVQEHKAEVKQEATVTQLPTPKAAPEAMADPLELAVGRALDTVLEMLADANTRLDAIQSQLSQTRTELNESRAEARTLTRQNLEYQVTISTLQSELNLARQALAAAEGELRVLRQRGTA